METVVKVTNLTKIYKEQTALKNLNLTIKKGDIYGLIGRNGAGKTTLLKILTRLVYADEGQVSIFGSRDERTWNEALKRVGSVIEDPVAYGHLSAYENLAYYCKAYGVPNADTVIPDVLSIVGLENNPQKKFRAFSLGMKQRMGIAIAFLSRPDLLILDEPTNGLDPIGMSQFKKMIQHFNEKYGTTIIISSHILAELYQVATKFGIIENGQLIKEMSKEEFEAASDEYIVLKTSDIEGASRVIREFLGMSFKVVGKNEIHIFERADQIKILVQTLVQEDIDVSQIHDEKTSLESYFTNLVEEEN
ncbi:ABC transporter ATP-binding protein [Streptococcus oricebi]|uniref:ABC transporter n=1 Tax=Streptococcus oricebi TaxID=1547447 RepID=A0ABS5B3N4_9STRE|nr:ABC transporter ATP-binding protein [Streptococcus oricebi]MBP2623073.1 ABC transporter [Streptococcus oricebi]